MDGRGWALVCLAVLVGCVDRASTLPSGVDDAVSAIDLIASHKEATTDPGALHYSAEEAQCFAGRVVSELGIDRLESLGLDLDEDTAPDLSQPPLDDREGDAVYGAMQDCVDLPAQIADILAAGGAPPAVAECMAERYLETDLPRRALVGAGHDPDLNAAIQGVLYLARGACD